MIQFPKPYADAVARLRVPSGFLIVVVFAWFSRPTPESMMLGVPTYAEVDNVYSLLHGGKIIGTYFQDQWRVNDKLTINWGLRYDITINPRQGKGSNGSNITGNFDFSNGTYILQYVEF